MAESGGSPDKPPLEEDGRRGGQRPDSEGDGGTRGAVVDFPWLVAGPDGKHTGIKGGPTQSPPRPPKTTTSTNTGNNYSKTYNSKTSGPSGSSTTKTSASHEASKQKTLASHEASKPFTPSKQNSSNLKTSTPKQSSIPIRDTTMNLNLTGNPEVTIIDPALTHDFLGTSRTTPDGFVLRPDGILFNAKTNKMRVPTSEEVLAWKILERQAEQRLKKKNPPQAEPSENAQERLKRNASQLSQNSTNPDTEAKKTKHSETTTNEKTSDEQPKTQDKQADKEVGYWNMDAIRLTTVRIISSTGRKLTNHDMTHIGQYHMKACYHNFGTDTDEWDEVAAERGNLVSPYTFAKFKIRTCKRD